MLKRFKKFWQAFFITLGLFGYAYLVAFGWMYIVAQRVSEPDVHISITGTDFEQAVKAKRCSELITWVNEDISINDKALYGAYINLACLEFGVVTNRTPDEVVKLIVEAKRDILIMLHDNSVSLCEVSNINTCVMHIPIGDPKEKRKASLILINNKFEDVMSSIRHEVHHVLFDLHGIEGQVQHHVLMRAFNICNALYRTDITSHLCGDIDDESVNLINRNTPHE